MTNERKAELYDELVNYVSEVVNDDEELIRVLLHLGFTKEEIIDDVWVEDEESFNETFCKAIEE